MVGFIIDIPDNSRVSWWHSVCGRFGHAARGAWLVNGVTAQAWEVNAMTEMPNQFAAHIGDTVFSADDHKLGVVKAVDARYLTVEHGLLKKSDYFIPISTVNAQSGGSLYLNVTKEEIEDRGWDAPPLIETEAGNPPLTR